MSELQGHRTSIISRQIIAESNERFSRHQEARFRKDRSCTNNVAILRISNKMISYLETSRQKERRKTTQHIASGGGDRKETKIELSRDFWSTVYASRSVTGVNK